MIKIVNPEQRYKRDRKLFGFHFRCSWKRKVCFISGQVPSDRAGCTMGTTMREQTEYVFQNLIKVLAANGAICTIWQVLRYFERPSTFS